MVRPSGLSVLILLAVAALGIGQDVPAWRPSGLQGDSSPLSQPAGLPAEAAKLPEKHGQALTAKQDAASTLPQAAPRTESSPTLAPSPAVPLPIESADFFPGAGQKPFLPKRKAASKRASFQSESSSIVAWPASLLVSQGETLGSIQPADEVEVIDEDINWLGADAPIWRPYVVGGWRGSDRRHIGETALFLPLIWSDRSLLFADLRGNFHDNGDNEGNWGLAFRHMLRSEWILGAYGFFDLRETERSHFEQATFGIEAMNLNWDFRMNGYVPDTTNPQLIGTPTAAISGGNIVVRSGFEAAFWGFDGEVGRLLFGRPQLELRAFIGGYYFDNPNIGFAPFGGPRGRLELRLYDLPLLGEGSRLTVETRIQYDELRDVVAEAAVQLRVPFGVRPGHRLSPIERRMVDTIIRDVDVVSVTQALEEPACFADSGVAIAGARVISANNDIAAEVPAAGPNSVVVVDGSASLIATAARVDLQTGQVVMGGGSQLAVRGCNTGLGAIFTAPGSRPQVHGASAVTDVFQIANNSTLTGLDISGGRDGVVGTSVTGFTLSNLRISGPADDGVDLNGSVSGNILGVTASGAVNNGFEISTFNGGTISGNSASGSFNGFSITTLNGGTISGNSASGNRFDGLVVFTMNGGTISGNTANGNAVNGFDIPTALNGGTISGNTAAGNTQHGFSMFAVNGGTISGNTASGNTVDGFSMQFNGGVASGNVSTGNTGDGFDIFFFAGNTTIFRNHSATNNTGRGYFVNGAAPAQGGGNTGANNTAGSNTGP